MKKVTKIKRSPRVVTEIKHEGRETIYWIGCKCFIYYEDIPDLYDSHQISSDGKFYRKVESQDHPDVQVIKTISPDDFSVTEHYFEPIEETEL